MTLVTEVENAEAMYLMKGFIFLWGGDTTAKYVAVDPDGSRVAVKVTHKVCFVQLVERVRVYLVEHVFPLIEQHDINRAADLLRDGSMYRGRALVAMTNFVRGTHDAYQCFLPSSGDSTSTTHVAVEEALRRFVLKFRFQEV